jgi:hypothetical protein
MPASRGCELAVVLPALVLASCLPAGDLASYSAQSRSAGAGLSASGEVVAPPPMVGSGNGGEGTPSMLGLASNPAADAGDAGLADAGSASGCAAARLGPSGNCYLIDATPRSWSDALAACQSLGNGWQLASLRSAEDSALAAQLLTIEAWIGASDAALEGTWTWVDRGDAFWSGDGTGSASNGAYANWNSNEPNGGEESDCARILPAGSPGLSAPWADLACIELRGALCEGPPG